MAKLWGLCAGCGVVSGGLGTLLLSSVVHAWPEVLVLLLAVVAMGSGMAGIVGGCMVLFGGRQT